MVQQPIQPKERIEALDIIRGFALFGVLLVNMVSFKGPFMYQIKAPTDFSSILDQGAAWFIQLFAVAKFYTTFSFLFGLGFFIFMDRAIQKELNAKKLFKRRLTFLFFLGLIHLCFLWSGDILHTYSLGGFLLMVFWNKKTEAIKKWIIFFIVLSVFLLGVMVGLQYMANTITNESALESYQEYQSQVATKAYGSSSYLELLRYRMGTEVPMMLTNNIVIVFMILPLFLLGLYMGKEGILKNLLLYGKQIRKIFFASLYAGIVLTLLIILLILNPMKIDDVLVGGIKEIIVYLSGITMSFLYITTIIILLLKGRLSKLLRSLAPVGRMALTNYLMQSLLATSIFYGYGLGLIGRIGPFMGIVFTVIIFTGQLIFSKLWMKHYNYGPMEWLWRRFTYGQLMKFRKAIN